MARRGRRQSISPRKSPESHRTRRERGLLTTREREILNHIWMGYTNKEMAPRLRISVKTIAAHRANIMRKMRVTNIAELLRTTIHSGVLAII